MARVLKENHEESEKQASGWCFRAPSAVFYVRENSSRISKHGGKSSVFCNNYFDNVLKAVGKLEGVKA